MSQTLKPYVVKRNSLRFPYACLGATLASLLGLLFDLRPIMINEIAKCAVLRNEQTALRHLLVMKVSFRIPPTPENGLTASDSPKNYMTNLWTSKQKLDVNRISQGVEEPIES